MNYTVKDLIQIKMQHYKKRAKVKGLSFELSFDDFKALLLADCFYCGLAASRGAESKPNHECKQKFRLNGIDRRGNQEGYTASNTVSCCASCNNWKGDLVESDWLAKIHAIASKHVQTTPASEESLQRVNDGVVTAHKSGKLASSLSFVLGTQ